MQVIDEQSTEIMVLIKVSIPIHNVLLDSILIICIKKDS